MASGGKMSTITAKAVGETTISISATDPVTHKTHRADYAKYVREHLRRTVLSVNR